MTRLLYIESSQAFGGSDLSLYELLRNLDRQRYKPVVLFYQPHPGEEHVRSLGLETIRLRDALPSKGRDPVFGWQEVPRAWHIARLIRKRRIDLVHHNSFLHQARADVVSAALAGVPQVCHVHNPANCPRLERPLARFVDAFLYVSDYVAKRYHEYGVPAEKGHVVYNPIDGERFYQPHARHSTRLELGIGYDDYAIANVARIDTWRGHDDFIEAIRQVIQHHSQRPRVRALIVGAFTPVSIRSGYAERLRQLGRDLEEVGTLIYTGFRSDVPELLAAADLVVHSATQPEGFGRAVAEAHAASKAVVATDAGGVTEIVESGVSGYIVPRHDPNAMAQAILRALRDPGTSAEMGARGRERVLQRFSMKAHVDAVQEVYERVLEKQ